MKNINSNYSKILYFLFFLSGATGLIYEIVWTRRFLLIFGNTTQSTTAVLSAYMLGLSLGSYFLGRIADKTKNPLKVYALLEFITALAALVSIPVFEKASFIYDLFLNQPNNGILMILLKFFVTGLSIVPATFVMGGTLPFIASCFRNNSTKSIENVSLLYSVNTFGAFIGVLTTGFVLIELLGLSNSLLLGTALNTVIAVLALWISSKFRFRQQESRLSSRKRISLHIGKYTRYIFLGIYAISGFIAISYEILWMRLLTPAVGTFVYALSLVLAFYLFGIGIGSYLYKIIFKYIKDPVIIFGMIQIGIFLAVLVSILANTAPNPIKVGDRIISTLLPATILMGMNFPALVQIINSDGNTGKNTGDVYAFNTLGSICGSIFSTFVFIPALGILKSILILAIVNALSGVLIIYLDKYFGILRKFFLGLLFLAAVVLIFANISGQGLLSTEQKLLIKRISASGDYQFKIIEDEASTVIGYRTKNGEKGLFIDGVPTTALVPETSFLGHLPFLINPQTKDVLIIALGMGTTFRSVLLHDNITVDAVELSPSVPKFLSLFHDDIHTLMEKNKSVIIINDGRNYIRNTSKKYDAIIIDPPPPVNAAGTTVLYSKEFYEASNRKLNDGGIIVSWFYSFTRVDDFKILLNTFYEVFPHILVLKSPDNIGYYLVGSKEIIKWDDERIKNLLKESVLSDINSYKLSPDQKNLTTSDILALYLGDEKIIRNFAGNSPVLTEDKPITEYFLIRRLKNNEPLMSSTKLLPTENIDTDFLK